LTVTLASSDVSEATIPTSVTIPAGSAAITVPVEAVDDDLLDGGQLVNLTASAAGFSSDNIDLAVTDHEFLTAVFSKVAVIEGDPSGITMTLSRSNTDNETDLVVASTGGDAGQLIAPATVAIPAGQSSVQATWVAVDDDLAEAIATLTYSFAASGYESTVAEVKVYDDEQPAFQNPTSRQDVDGLDGITAFDALLIINRLPSDNESALDLSQVDFGGLYYDVDGDYGLSSFDALLVINALQRAPSNFAVAPAGLSAPDLSAGAPLQSGVAEDDEDAFQTGSLF